jgi:hypothetical protein
VYAWLRLSLRSTCLGFSAESSLVICLDSATRKDTRIVLFGMLCSETSTSPERAAKFGDFSPPRAQQNFGFGFAEKPKRLLQSYYSGHEDLFLSLREKTLFK